MEFRWGWSSNGGSIEGWELRTVGLGAWSQPPTTNHLPGADKTAKDHLITRDPAERYVDEKREVTRKARVVLTEMRYGWLPSPVGGPAAIIGTRIAE